MIFWEEGPLPGLADSAMIAYHVLQLSSFNPLAHYIHAGALQQRVITLTAELAAAQQGHASTRQHAAEAEQLLDEARAASEQLRTDLAAAQAALDRSTASEASYKADDQAAREQLETYRCRWIFCCPWCYLLLNWPDLHCWAIPQSS